MRRDEQRQDRETRTAAQPTPEIPAPGTPPPASGGLFFRWFLSSTVREGCQLAKHVRKLLCAQRDILKPDAIEIHFRLAIIASERNDSVNAVEEFRHCIERQPENPYFHYLLGREFYGAVLLAGLGGMLLVLLRRQTAWSMAFPSALP